MTKARVTEMIIDQLVDRFSQLALRQHDALEFANASQYNALYEQMSAVRDELRRRGSFAVLERLLTHSNITVRLEAARRLIKDSPSKVRPVAQAIAQTRRLPWAADATGMIEFLDKHPEVWEAEALKD